MFNDDVQMGFFDLYDQYLLNILYDSRIRPGMTREQVKALLPDVLPAVRERVSRANPRVSAELQELPGEVPSDLEVDCNCLPVAGNAVSRNQPEQAR
jgi:serine/threonine protein kinase HipA of HipAB toxin-antitoxin module